MSKYDVAHSCGHEEGHPLFGPHKERERKMAWLEGQPCTSCRRAAQDKERAAESGKAASEASTKGLPELEGSPKQIAWAESIRKKALDDNLGAVLSPEKKERVLANAERFGLPESALTEKFVELETRMAAEKERLQSTTSAKWWIDNKDKLGSWIKDRGEALTQEIFAEAIAFAEAEKQQSEATEKQKLEAKREQERLEREHEQKEKSNEAAKAGGFRVGNRPDTVTVSEHGDSFTVRAIDGRVAHGFIDGGEWVVYMIGDKPIDSSHPGAMQIAQEAKEQHKKPKMVIVATVKEGKGIAKVTKRQETRSAKAQIADASKQAKIVVSIHEPAPWLKNPNRVDIIGIDTPKTPKVSVTTPKGKSGGPQQQPRGPGLLLLNGKLVRQKRGSVLH